MNFGRFKTERSYFIAFNPMTNKCKMYNKITGQKSKFYWHGSNNGDEVMSLNRDEIKLLESNFKPIRIEPLKHLSNTDFSDDFPKLYKEASLAWDNKYKR